MRRLWLAAAFLAASYADGLAEDQTVILAVEMMTCAVCPITVTKAIESVDGVKHVTIDLDTKRAVVLYDDAIATWEKLAEASTNAGYPASKVE